MHSESLRHHSLQPKPKRLLQLISNLARSIILSPQLGWSRKEARSLWVITHKDTSLGFVVEEKKRKKILIPLEGGLEPPTLWLTATRSNQLSYSSLLIKLNLNINHIVLYIWAQYNMAYSGWQEVEESTCYFNKMGQEVQGRSSKFMTFWGVINYTERQWRKRR